jgi:hypothetical protein
MKKTAQKSLGIIAGILLLAGSPAHSQSTINLDPGASWVGYMNVFNLPSAGGGYLWGSGWGTADLTATFSGSTLTLGPNQIGDPSSYWYTPSGGTGATGNKIMDANMYVETASGLYSGQTLTFTANVLANTLVGKVDANGNGWTAVAFIKDFAPDFSSFVSSTVALTPGAFSISLATINDASRHIQYGFEVIGPNVWATDVGDYGTIQIAPVPEPSTLALCALGGLSLGAAYRRRRQA